MVETEIMWKIYKAVYVWYSVDGLLQTITTM